MKRITINNKEGTALITLTLTLILILIIYVSTLQTHDSECILDTKVNMKTNNLRFDAKGLQNNSQKTVAISGVMCFHMAL